LRKRRAVKVSRDDIAPLRSARHARLKLPAGERRVAIGCLSSLSGLAADRGFPAHRARQAAQLAIAPHKARLSVEPLSGSEGRRLLSRSVCMKVLH